MYGHPELVDEQRAIFRASALRLRRRIRRAACVVLVALSVVVLWFGGCMRSIQVMVSDEVGEKWDERAKAEAEEGRNPADWQPAVIEAALAKRAPAEKGGKAK